MADIRINPQAVTREGVTPTYTGGLTTVDRYLVKNNGRLILHFKKSGNGVCTVTVETPVQYQGLDVENPTVEIPADTGDRIHGVFNPDTFNDKNGDLAFTLSDITGLEVAAVRF